MHHLTDQDKRMLYLAGRTYQVESSRERDVWDAFGISMVRFWQQVRELIVTEPAIAHSPLTCSRLRRRIIRPVVNVQPVARFEAGWNRSA